MLTVVFEPAWPGVLARWSFEPAVVAGLLSSSVVYEIGIRAQRHGPSGGERAAFRSGLVVTAVALLSPVATYGEALLSVHMVQHLLLTLVAAPLFLLGHPFTVTRGVLRWPDLTRWNRCRLKRFATHPVVAWAQFAVAGWAIHFSPLFDEALDHTAVHGLEHIVFLASALLFWWPVVARRGAGAGRLSHPLRLLYLAVAMPQNTFLALAVFSNSTVLYGHYARLGRRWGPSPLADQRQGGGIMWVAGDLARLASVLLVAAAWARHEQRGDRGVGAPPADRAGDTRGLRASSPDRS